MDLTDFQMTIECLGFLSDELEEFVLGHPAGERASAIAAHVSVCAECRQRLDETQTFVAEMQEALWLFSLGDERPAPAVVIPMPARERRASSRATGEEPATLQFESEVGTFRTFSAWLVDVSQEGAVLVAGGPLPLRAVAAVHLTDRSFQGVVQYCAATGSGFRLGLRLIAAA